MFDDQNYKNTSDVFFNEFYKEIICRTSELEINRYFKTSGVGHTKYFRILITAMGTIMPYCPDLISPLKIYTLAQMWYT